MTSKVDSITDYTSINNKIVPMYRGRIYSKHYGRMLLIDNNANWHKTTQAAWAYAEKWAS